jgi:hypothetical protein
VLLQFFATQMKKARRAYALLAFLFLKPGTQHTRHPHHHPSSSPPSVILTTIRHPHESEDLIGTLGLGKVNTLAEKPKPLSRRPPAAKTRFSASMPAYKKHPCFL